MTSNCSAACQSVALSRRNFLVGATTSGFVASISSKALSKPVSSQPPTKGSRWIDVHHHLVPPRYLAKIPMEDAISGASASRHALEQWTIQRSLDQMDLAGVQGSILSLSNPGVWFGDAPLARDLARECNEYAAKLIATYPGRFGMFAVLPLPDLDGSLKELAYALDILKADGVGLYTSYQNKWLGDASFDPLFAELNRRRVVAYVHPTAADCCRALKDGVPSNLIEYQTDTSRAIAGILAAGIPTRYPDVKIIFSHAGGTLPFLIERFIGWAKTPSVAKALPQGLIPALASFYYDTAQASNPIAMGALSKLVPSSQILFGTDYPFRTVEEHVDRLIHCAVFDADQLQGIGREHAVALIPRLGSTSRPLSSS